MGSRSEKIAGKIAGLESASKDPQTVTSSGERVGKSIDGVTVRPLPVHSDPRGDLSELISEEWPEIAGVGIPYAYVVGHQPGSVRG